MKDVLIWFAVFVQLVAAILWFFACSRSVSQKSVNDKYQSDTGIDWLPSSITSDSDGSDFVASVALQSKWNMWAALATGMGVALQAVYMIIPAV